MGWNIALIENTAVVPEEVQAEVARWFIRFRKDEFADAVSGNIYEKGFAERLSDHDAIHTVLSEGKLTFSTDAMEHMDYVTGDDEICAMLAHSGTTGRIAFGSLEGDNRNTFWGVEFASGHYRRINATTANIVWNIGTSIAG